MSCDDKFDTLIDYLVAHSGVGVAAVPVTPTTQGLVEAQQPGVGVPPYCLTYEDFCAYYAQTDSEETYRVGLTQMSVQDMVAHFEERQDDGWRVAYEQLVLYGVRSGNNVPAKVLLESPAALREFRDKLRYQRARHTAFDNEAGTDTSMLAERGYKTKRQDGAAITLAQNAQIARGMDEIEAVWGH